MSAAPAAMFPDKPTTATPKKSLASKLAEVMGECHRIQKRGRNDFHKYDYATESDIVEAVREGLASRSVMLIPSVVKQTREPVGDKGSILTTLEMLFTFMDGDSGEQIERAWIGAGSDKEDKGLYKAMAGATKYFLLKTFLLPTGDDPERDDNRQRERPRGTVVVPRGVNVATGEVTEETRPSADAPAGYVEWLEALNTAAGQSKAKFDDVFLDASVEKRQYLTADTQRFLALKKKAAGR